MKWIPLILVLVGSLAHAEFSQSQFKIELSKAEDSAEITSTHNGAVITVDSKSGIGTARLTRTGKRWPARLTIRLNIKGLESFRMENGFIHFTTSLKSPKQTPYWKTGKSQNQVETPEGTLEITITGAEKTVEVVVPAEMMDGNPETISFAWIDFFRA